LIDKTLFKLKSFDELFLSKDVFYIIDGVYLKATQADDVLAQLQKSEHKVLNVSYLWRVFKKKREAIFDCHVHLLFDFDKQHFIISTDPKVFEPIKVYYYQQFPEGQVQKIANYLTKYVLDLIKSKMK
jgi:hypothetical protein